MIDRRGQLAWIQLNRTEVVRAVQLGQVARAWADGLNGGETGVVRRINVSLRPVVDEMFRRWCVVSGVDRGTLIIAVNDASLVGWMARAWRAHLIDVLAKTGLGVSDVRFEYHRAPLMMTGGERE